MNIILLESATLLDFAECITCSDNRAFSWFPDDAPNIALPSENTVREKSWRNLKSFQRPISSVRDIKSI